MIYTVRELFQKEKSIWIKMRQYLIDTDICVYFLKGKFGLIDKIDEVGLENCFISEITIIELTYGAYKSTNFAEHILDVAKIKHLFEVLPISDSIEKYAEEKVRLQRLGQLIPDFDLLIAATAATHNMTMVTRNEKHLARVDGVIIENWTKYEFNRFV